MSKVGDVIVKLLLKSDEYEKGLKRGRSATDQFASSVSRGVTSALGKFTAIIGVVSAVIGAIGKLSQSNQQLSDAWGRMTAAMSAGWDLVFRKIASLDFSHLLRDLREVGRYAREAYDALDAMGEITTSYNISLARQAKEIALLKTDLRDMTKSDEERIAAGEKLLEIYNNLETGPTSGLANVMNTTLDRYLVQMGYNIEGASDEVMAVVRKKFVDLFVWLGTSEGTMASSAAQDALKALGGHVARFRSEMAQAGLTQEQIDFAEKYNKYLNDKDRAAIEKVVVSYYNQEAKYSEEVLRIQTQINSLRHQAANSAGPAAGPTPEQLELQRLKAVLGGGLESVTSQGLTTIAESLQMPDLISDDWIARQEEQTRKFEDLLDKVTDISLDFSMAVQQGIVAGINELASAVSAGENIDAGAMISALLSPLADACIAAGLLIMTTGKGVEALRDTLLTGLVTGGMSAIAAGALMVGVGAAAKIGLAAIASGSRGAGSGGSLSTSASSPASAAGASAENVEMTVHIEGLVIKGSDLVLATDRARAELGR